MPARQHNAEDVALSLTLAVVTSSPALLLLDGDLSIIAASTSFCAVFRCDPAETAHEPIVTAQPGPSAIRS